MQTSLGKILSIIILLPLHLYAYSFSMHMDNTHPMLGEKCILTLSFKYNNLEEYEIEEPKFENFEIVLLEDKESQDNNTTWHVEQRYQLTPTKAGTVTLSPLKTHIEMIEKQYEELYNRNTYLKKFDIFTQPITISTQALPQDITVTGEYQLYAYIDKNSTILGKPIHFTLGIKGEGNIDNLDFLTLNIPETTIYEKTNSEQEKSFDIVSNSNFTIPVIMLRYYNQQTKQIELLSTRPFQVEVMGSVAKKESSSKFWWFLFPLLTLFPLLFSLPKFFIYDEKKALKKQLKNCKERETLLKKLMPYLHKNRQLTRLIYQLEEVEKKEFKSLKREIIKHF